MESSMEVPQKLKNRTIGYPVILLLGIYLKKMKTVTHKDICTPLFIETLFIIAKIWKQPKCPSVDE